MTFTRGEDDRYAATPAFVALKVLLTLALANRWGNRALAIGIAFLHTPLPTHPRVLAWPLDDQTQFQELSVAP